MKTILVPCDFSFPAINALRLALDLASQSKGTVCLLNVIELPALHDTVIMPVLYFEETYFKEVKETTERRFKKLLEKFNIKGVEVITEVAFGSPVKTIIDVVKKRKADLIVMGSSGASGAKEFWIGSNTEKIVRSSPVPVLTVKDLYKGTLKRIVFPNTLEEDQEDLITKVKVLQEFFKAHLNIVWINTPGNFQRDSVTFKRLEAFAKRYMLKDYTLDVFNHTNEDEGIVLYTQHVKGNLIALGTHGRKGLAHLINGSIAENVVNHSNALIWTSIAGKRKLK